MNLTNQTDMIAGHTLGLDKTGREFVIAVIKGTFQIPRDPLAEPSLASKQLPLITADEFSGEPGFSAPTFEMDFAQRKPRCDVLLMGSAYAPGNRPVERVTIRVQVGSMQKGFDVVGDRVWQAGAFTLGMSRPKLFTVQPFSYDRAFGGVDRAKGDPLTYRWYPTNHAGIGWHEYLDTQFLDGTLLPNTEETNNPIKKPNGSYRPMAMGPIGRAWLPRVSYGGTYDQKWKDEKAPFLPDDFDEHYFQSTVEDQQIGYPAGGESVSLINLTPEGRTEFKLPNVTLPVLFLKRNGEHQETEAIVDTILLDPDHRRFSLVWRARLALRRNPFEVREIIVNERLRRWHRAQLLLPKPHLDSLVHSPNWKRSAQAAGK